MRGRRPEKPRPARPRGGMTVGQEIGAGRAPTRGSAMSAEVRGRAGSKAGSEPAPAAPAVRERAPSRVIIEGVQPEIDCGRFPIKRTVGEEVLVAADIFAEGHDVLRAVIKYRPLGTEAWAESP